MINRKNTMTQEEYGYFIDIETNAYNYFPDNLKSMNEKYNIRSTSNNYHKFNNKYSINVNLNIMTTIPEINENSSHNHVSKNTCSYKFPIFILLLFVICFKCYYFLHNFV